MTGMFLHATHTMLQGKLISDSIWHTATSGALALYFTFTGAVLGLYKLSNVGTKIAAMNYDAKTGKPPEEGAGEE